MLRQIQSALQAGVRGLQRWLISQEVAGGSYEISRQDMLTGKSVNSPSQVNIYASSSKTTSIRYLIFINPYSIQYFLLYSFPAIRILRANFYTPHGVNLYTLPTLSIRI
jgi:hypothetical protein